MSRLSSVLLAIDLAKRQRDGASQVVSNVCQTCSSAEDQIGQLQSYAIDTESKWSVNAQVLAGPEVVHHYYCFMVRLQEAIELQRKVVADLQLELARARRLLLEAELRIARLNKLLEQKRMDGMKLHAAREQRQFDEFAALQHLRLRARSETGEIR